MVCPNFRTMTVKELERHFEHRRINKRVGSQEEFILRPRPEKANEDKVDLTGSKSPALKLLAEINKSKKSERISSGFFPGFSLSTEAHIEYFSKALEMSGFQSVESVGQCKVIKAADIYSWKLAFKASTSFEVVLALDKNQVLR